MNEVKILMIEDNEVDAKSFKRSILSHLSCPCDIRHVERMADAVALLGEGDEHMDFDLVLLDLELPDTVDRIDTLKRIEAANVHDVPTVILTSISDRELARSVVGDRALDFLNKSRAVRHPGSLARAIDFALCRHERKVKSEEEKQNTLLEKNRLIQCLHGSYSVQA